MKYISFLCLYSIVFSSYLIAEPSLRKSEILRKSNECFKDFQYEVCKNLILQMEKIQLIEFEQNRYKCQSSILGLQTEFVEAYYFKEFNKSQRLIMMPYVIKNC